MRRFIGCDGYCCSVMTECGGMMPIISFLITTLSLSMAPTGVYAVQHPSPCTIPTWAPPSFQFQLQRFNVSNTSSTSPVYGLAPSVVSNLMNGTIHLCWRYTPSQNKITFALLAKNRGWVGFGVSRGGGMTNADITVFQKDLMGNHIAVDMFSKSNQTGPRKDRQQDVELHAAHAMSVTQVFLFVFSRKILTPCDTWDVPLNLDGAVNPNELIFAYGRKLDYGVEFGQVRDIEGHGPGRHSILRGVNLFPDGNPVVVPGEC
eukprot:PhF_6_TR21031/c1_g1_i1/m.30247